MARAQFHKNQRVYVKPVGTWALVERVLPQWTKGLSEPIRVFYDVGLGRDFSVEELQAEMSFEHAPGEDREEWRVVRARNKWQSAEETSDHPYPGTYPLVVTGETEWGGWRVPGAEYALSPTRVERQARVIAAAPRMASVVTRLTAWAKTIPNDVPEALRDIIRDSGDVSAYLASTAD